MAKIFNRDVVFGGQIKPKGLPKTATSGAVTLDRISGIITTASLTTAAAATYTLTITNNKILATSIVLVTIGDGTNSQGTVMLNTVAPADGSVVIVLTNDHASSALNGTLKVSFLVLNPETSLT